MHVIHVLWDGGKVRRLFSSNGLAQRQSTEAIHLQSGKKADYIGYSHTVWQRGKAQEVIHHLSGGEAKCVGTLLLLQFYITFNLTYVYILPYQN